MANYLDNVYWKVGWYAIASLVGTARIYHDKHWLSDVVMGSAIGYFVGDYVSKNPENRLEQEGNPLQDYDLNFRIPLN
jgi:PAP2 superfamily